MALAVGVIVIGSWWWLDSSPQLVTQPTNAIGIDSEPIPEFTYTNQDGESFGFSQLKGKVWIANVIFTRCPDVGSPMTANLSRIQKRLQEEGAQAELVSFSVDPLYDTPEVMKQYGENLRADFSNWNFLTHDDSAAMHRFLQTSFREPVEVTSHASEEALTINHSTRLYVMDPTGRVLTTYNGLQPDMDAIVRDVLALGEAEGLMAKR